MSFIRKDSIKVEQVSTYLHGKLRKKFYEEMAHEEMLKAQLARELIKEALAAREERRHNGAKTNRL